MIFVSCAADMSALGGDSFLEVAYEQKCQSEVIRQTKGSKIIGMAVSRVCEKRIGMFSEVLVSFCSKTDFIYISVLFFFSSQ